MKRRMIIFPGLLSLAVVAAVGGWLALHRPHDVQPQALDPIERAAGLDRRIAQLHLSGVSFQKAIDDICAKSGVRIVVSPKLASMPLRVLDSIRVAPAQMGLGMPVDLDFQDVTVANVLDVLIDQAQRQFAKPIGFTAVEDGTVVIAAEDELPRIVRAYDVRAVLKKLAEASRGARGRVFLGNVDVGDPRQVSPEQQLLELVMANRHADFWIRPPVYRDPAWCAGGKLVVLETRRRHREIERILQRLRQLGPPW